MMLQEPGQDPSTRRLGGRSRGLGLELRDLLACGGDKFVIGVGVAPQAPAPRHGLGQEHPGAAGERRVTGRVRDHAGELAHHRDLLIAVQSTRVGMTAQMLPVTPGLLDELTTQQREVAILAARGLTNGEIADRLFLSPRTVASHLYRSYPKLGIAGRHQLRDLIDHAGAPQAN